MAVPDDPLRWINRALSQIDPNGPYEKVADQYLWAGRLARQTGEPDLAVRCLEKALQSIPNGPILDFVAIGGATLAEQLDRPKIADRFEQAALTEFGRSHCVMFRLSGKLKAIRDLKITDAAYEKLARPIIQSTYKRMLECFREGVSDPSASGLDEIFRSYLSAIRSSDPRLDRVLGSDYPYNPEPLTESEVAELDWLYGSDQVDENPEDGAESCLTKAEILDFVVKIVDDEVRSG